MSLNLTTPTVTRPIPEEATGSRHNRKPGAVGWLLDPAPIVAYIRETYLEGDEDTKVITDEFLLLRSPSGKLAIIGTEGVGIEADESSPTVPVYVGIGFMWQDIEIPHDVIERSVTGEGVDVAGFIRLFGDRLNVNAYIWRNFVLAE